MQLFLCLLLFLIFNLLATIHFYWAFGGKRGFEQALPTNEKGEKMLNPGKMASGIVGFGLSLFAFYYLQKSGLLEVNNLPDYLTNYTGWVISIIFLLRAIGDFKYVGFFKRIKQTGFGRLDTRYFAPLCLFIGVIGVILELI